MQLSHNHSVVSKVHVEDNFPNIGFSFLILLEITFKWRDAFGFALQSEI
jgi:hypothetical protein